MQSTRKKILLSTFSILSATVLVWTLLIANPSWCYAHATSLGHVTVFHNSELTANASEVISNAVAIIKQAGIWEAQGHIDLCLNDDSTYPALHPLAGEPLAYAVLDKTVLKNCEVDFEHNVAETRWAINDHEHRKFNLTWLLAHEFTHNLQYAQDRTYYLSSTLNKINWKLEGHADYIARRMKQSDLRTLVETCLRGCP